MEFRHCGGLYKDDSSNPTNAGSYFGYIDQGQYLNGVAAGHATKSKKIGFVAAKPIPQVLRNINAFTLGARRSTDDHHQVIFTGDWTLPVNEAEATNALIEPGGDVITCHVDSPKVVVETAEGAAFTSAATMPTRPAGAQGFLTGAEWNWSPSTRITPPNQNRRSRGRIRPRRA